MTTIAETECCLVTRELFSLTRRRGRDKALADGTVTRSIHAIKAVDSVLSLGVRAAMHADYWHRHAAQRIESGIAASTVCAELNAVAAVIKWILESDLQLKSMSPGAARSVHDAIREAARKAGKSVKRYAALAKPARVSVDEFDIVVRDIMSFKSPHKELCLMMLCFALRVSESLYLSERSIIAGRIFIPDRVIKTRANLLLPVPVKYISRVRGWVNLIQASPVTYAALEMYITRKGVKWRAHDLRKLFRTAATVRGDDYLAAELILNHDIGDVPNVYLQKPPYKQMRQIIHRTISEVMSVQ